MRYEDALEMGQLPDDSVPSSDETRWFDRTDTWTDFFGTTRNISEMHPRHISNVIALLVRNARKIHFRETGGAPVELSAVCSHEDDRKAGLTPVHGEASQEAALGWLHGTPVWMALNRTIRQDDL